MTTRAEIQQRANDFKGYLISSSQYIKESAGKAIGRCPKPDHEDKHPSFSYCPEKDAWVCSCGKGKGSELRSLLGYTHPVDFFAGDVEPPIEAKSKPRPDGDPDCIHEYSNGNRKLKWRNPKNVSWEHKDGDRWASGMSGDPGLYNQDKIETSSLILFSESESDCDSLMALGYVAVSTPHGASDKSKGAQIKEHHAELLKGKLVAILPHNDDPGRAYANSCSLEIAKHAKKVWQVPLPEAYNDVRDAIEDGGADRAALDALIEYAKPKPPLATTIKNLVQETDEQIDYIVDPLIINGGICQFQGESKGGKSCFAFYLALAIAHGDWIAGKFRVPKPRRVLFCTWEDGPIRIKRRANQYNPPMKLGDLPDNLVVYTHKEAPRMWVNNPDGAAFFDEIIEANQAEVVVIDTLSYLHNAEENKANEMKIVMEEIRRIAVNRNCAIVLIHHTRKSGSQGDQGSAQSRGRGSGAIVAAADTIIDWGKRIEKNLTRCEFISKDDDGFDFDVAYIPAYDADGNTSSVAWEIRESDGMSIRDRNRMNNEKDILKAVEDLYKEGKSYGATIKGVIAKTKKARSTVQRILESLEAENKISSTYGDNKKRLYYPVK